MRRRYATVDGQTVQTASVYTAADHNISEELLDRDAVKVVRRLQRHGYDAYIVGGAVRDLLLGKEPKDFDIATSASPPQIRRLFRNSRTIGKRFRLVHIMFQSKIIEVSTFRSSEAEGFKNVYGTIDEDVLRRDFTANALFLDPKEHTIVDYVDGVRHLRERVLRPVIPLGRIFVEDPVRMIRATKYASTGGMRIPWAVRRRIRRDRRLLAETPSSRMTEELFKILNTGAAAPIVTLLQKLGLFESVVPECARTARNDSGYRRALAERLEHLDRRWAGSGALSRAELLAAIGADYMTRFGPRGQGGAIEFGEAFAAFKTFLQPITPPNRDVESAIELMYGGEGSLRLVRGEEPVNGRRGRPRRRRRKPRDSSGQQAEG